MSSAGSMDPDLILESVAISSRRTISPGVAGVGLRSHPVRYDNLSSSAFPRTAEEFLRHSRLSRWDRESLLSIASYAQDAEVVARSKVDTVPTSGRRLVDLPPTEPLTQSLTAVVSTRRSTRRFSSDALPLAVLGSILRHAASVTAVGDVDLEVGGAVETSLRAHPSAGGIYPLQTWWVSSRTDGLSSGVFRYATDVDALEVLPGFGPETVDRVLAAFDVEDGSVNLDSAAGVLLLIAIPWRAMRKYGARGMRFVFHEAGSIATGAHLAATALGVGSLDYAGFYDDELNNVLSLDGTFEAVVHTIVLGRPQ